MPLLEKAKGELPVKAPPPTKKEATTKQPVVQQRPPSFVADDEDEVDSRPANKLDIRNDKGDSKTKAANKAKPKVCYRV